MHLCVLCASRYFSVMISKDVYLTIFMFVMISCGFLPSLVSIVLACASSTNQAWVTYTAHLVGPWACVWPMCEEELRVQPYLNWKAEPKAML